MPLDLNKVKSRLAALQNKGGGNKFEKTDFSKIFWKPKLGSQQVRIVPSKFNKEWPFQQVLFHKDIIKKQMYCLTNFGEKDPIIEFINALKTEAASLKKEGKNSEEEWNLAKKLRPKSRTYAQVIIRGEEHLGTRLWEFGAKVEEQLLKIAANPDFQDFTDINQGYDLNVEGIDAYYEGTKYVEPSISPRKNSSPLSTHADIIIGLLENQHDPLGFAFNKVTYDQMEAYFTQWLGSEEKGEAAQSIPEEVQEVKLDVDELPFDNPTYTIEKEPKKKKTTRTKNLEIKEPVIETIVITPKQPEVPAGKKTSSVSNKAKFKNLFGDTK